MLFPGTAPRGAGSAGVGRAREPVVGWRDAEAHLQALHRLFPARPPACFPCRSCGRREGAERDSAGLSVKAAR